MPYKIWKKNQQKLKEFTLSNSARAELNFLDGSLKLDKLRMEYNEANEFFNVVKIVSDTIRNGNVDNDSYLALRSKYPLIDDVRFRRILGMSEIISSWNWPDEATTQAVSATLSDRMQRLIVEISDLESEAQAYASSAEVLAKLTGS